MSFPLAISKLRSLSITNLYLIAGLVFIELLLILSLVSGKFVFFLGGVFLTVSVLVILKNLNLGLCLLPVALGTSIMIIPAFRFHLAEFVIIVTSLSLLAHLAFENKKEEWIFPQKGPILLFLFACVISLSNAHYLNVGITHIIKLVIAFVLIFSLVYNRINNHKLLVKVSMGLILAGLVASIYGLGQYLSGPASKISFEAARIFGRAGGLYAGVVGLSIVFLCSYLLFAREGRRKILACFFLIPPIFAFILSHIRAWYVGILIALAFIVLLKVRRTKKLKPLIILAVVSVLSLLLFFSFLVEQSLAAFKFLFIRGLDLPTWSRLLSVGTSLDISFLARINIWRYAWKQFLEHPLTGVGVANFRISDPFRPGLSKPIEGHGYTDNQYISILVETGTLGAIAWAWLLTNLFLSSRRFLRSSINSELEWISVGLVGSVLLFLVGGMFWCLTPLLNEACLTAFLFSLIFAAEGIITNKIVPVTINSELQDS